MIVVGSDADPSRRDARGRMWVRALRAAAVDGTHAHVPASSAERAPLGQNFGMVFRMAGLFDSVTVEENRAFPSVQQAGASKQQIREIVMNCLQAHGLQGAATKLIGGAS